MTQITDEYYKAFNDGKLKTLKRVADYFGRVTHRAARKFCQDGLIIYHDEYLFALIVTYEGEIVAAELPGSLIFKDGDWWKIIENLQGQVEEATRAAYAERIREYTKEMSRAI